MVSPNSLIGAASTSVLTDLIEHMAPPNAQAETFEIANGLKLVIPSPNTFELAITTFFGSTGHIFHPYSLDEAQQLLVELSTHGQDISEVSLAEICAISCVGERFSQNIIREDIGDLFYVAARNLLENIIETNSWKAIRVCALLVIYTIMRKPRITPAIIGKS
jgi:hypothetical protein